MEFSEPKITGNKYFEYDELICYSIEINEDEVNSLLHDEINHDKNTLKKKIILLNFPDTINETEFIFDLEKIGFLKYKINEKAFFELNNIFIEKKHSMLYASGCGSIYRDILIFKNKSDIIGIAKICFECHVNWILGTKSDTSEFGMSGDYDKLKNILDNYKTSC